VSFAWPYALLAVLLAPALLAAYLWSLRRRRRYAVRHPDLALVRAALPARSRWRPHVPVALLVLGVGLLGLAVARPQASVDVPIQRSAIILALDVSRSMCATDVAPNRLSAARAAVKDFVTTQPTDTRIGLVAFSGSAVLVVPPTVDAAQLLASLDALSTGRGTAIGSAILTSVDAIAAINPQVQPVGEVPLGPDTMQQPGVPAPVPSAVDPPPGATAGYVSDIVVLLTDGANTRGVLPAAAATIAAERRIRIYPIGFGTTNPTQMVCSAQDLGGDAFGEFGPRSGGQVPGGAAGGGGFGGGGRNFLTVDEPTLKVVAASTGGTYHQASDAAQLGEVLRGIPREVVLQRQDVEVTAYLAILAALLVAGALVLSVRWNPLA
jgi:Ca-activated chloride channel family protein